MTWISSILDPNFFIERWCIMLIAASIIAIPATASKAGLGSLDPEFLEPLTNVTVTAGRDVKLQCSVSHLGNNKVAWIFMKYMKQPALLTVQNHVITRNPRVSVSHDNHHTWNLHISSVEESDEGAYMCQINTVVAKSQIGYIAVVVPPTIDDKLSSSDVTVGEGSSVVLTCNATGTPPLTVRWRREDGKPIRVNRTPTAVDWEGTHLELSRVSRHDMGAYLCIASNGVPPSVSKRITLTVEFAPNVNISQQLIGAPLGSNVSLDCLIESSPMALHFWSRNDSVVLHDSAKYIIRTSTSSGSIGAWTQTWTQVFPSYRIQSKLTIVNVEPDDYGKYRCIAKNPLGDADGTIEFHHTYSQVPLTSIKPNIVYPISADPKRSHRTMTNNTHSKENNGSAGSQSSNVAQTKNKWVESGKAAKTPSDSKWTYSWELAAKSYAATARGSCCLTILMLLVFHQLCKGVQDAMFQYSPMTK